MTVNYFSPVAITLALLPRMVERGSGTIVNVSSLGGRLGIAQRGRLQRLQVRHGRVERSRLAADLVGTGVAVRLVLPGSIDTEIWDQPDNDPPDYAGPLTAGRGGGRRDRRACIASDQFEHYLPDMRAVVEMKTKDFDGFVAGMRAMAGHRRTGRHRERGREGAGVRGPSRPGGGPAGADRRARGATGRPALRPPRDGRRPAHPSRLGGHPAHSLGRLRLGHQAGARANSRTGTSTIRWPPSRRFPTCPGTRWWPRWWPWARRPGASRSGSGWCSTRG